MKDIDLSIVILSWNTRELTRACLSSLAVDTIRYRREIIVVDNASEDGSPDMVAAEFPDVILLRNDENRLYAEGNNQGARYATGHYLCLLNSDTEVRRGALDCMLTFLENNPAHAAVAPKLVNPDGSVQRGCSRFPGLLLPVFTNTVLGRFWPGTVWINRARMSDFDHLQSRDVDQPPASCLMLRRREYLDVGGLDPRLSLYYNDVDLCRKLWRRGRRIRYFVEATVLHHLGASTQQLRPRVLRWRNRVAYYEIHYGGWVVPWLRLIRNISDAQIWLGIHLGPKDAPAKRTALENLRAYRRELREA